MTSHEGETSLHALHHKKFKHHGIERSKEVNKKDWVHYRSDTILMNEVLLNCVQTTFHQSLLWRWCTRIAHTLKMEENVTSGWNTLPSIQGKWSFICYNGRALNSPVQNKKTILVTVLCVHWRITRIVHMTAMK